MNAKTTLKRLSAYFLCLSVVYWWASVLKADQVTAVTVFIIAERVVLALMRKR